MPVTTTEYDAFGPWIYEITTPEDVPRLYRSHPLDLAKADMTIKVPRQIDRRDANPTMDLYDMVVSLGPDVITVLTRRGRAFTSRELAYEQVQGVTEVVDLLDGRLTLHSDDEPVVVRFNGSSSEIIADLVKRLRGRYVSAAAAAAGGARSVAPAPDVERDLQNLYRRLGREGGAASVVAVQRRHVVAPVGAGVVGRAIARAWPTTLLTSVITVGPAEIQVLGRGRPFATGFKPVTALARTLLPIERVRSVEVRPNEQHEGVAAVVIRIGHVQHEVHLDDGAADDVAEQLRAAVQR